MERELNMDTIMDGFQGIEAAFKSIETAKSNLIIVYDWIFGPVMMSKMRAMAMLSSELGVSMQECEKAIELLAGAGDAELSSEQKRAVYTRDKRMKERMAYLQSFDQRKKSQMIKREIRYQKKLP